MLLHYLVKHLAPFWLTVAHCTTLFIAAEIAENRHIDKKKSGNFIFKIINPAIAVMCFPRYGL